MTQLMNENSSLSCPHCSAHELRSLGKLPESRWFAGLRLKEALPGGTLYHCCHCKLKFRHLTHELIRYQQMYDNAVISTWSADTVRPDWDMIIGQIRESIPRGGRILDFGCYTGGLLSRLGAGYERHGIEINKAAAAIVTDKHLAKIWPSIDDIPDELRFDAVIASDVIEHMSDPGHLIDKLFNLVKDNGCLIMTTGDADNNLWNRFGANWWYCFYPEHISFISKIWLDRFVQKHGMTIEKCERFHYCRLSRMRLIATVAMTYFYGYLPSTYIFLNNMLRSMLRRSSLTSVPGNGVSADHLFIVFVRNGIRA